MTRSVTMGADWNAMRPQLQHGRPQLWSRFALEVRPDTIVSPLLFLAGEFPGAARESGAGPCYTLAPGDFVLLHGRGEEHVRFLLDEVAPLLADVRVALVLDADARVVHFASEPHRTIGVDEMSALLQATTAFADPDWPSGVVESLADVQARVFRGLPSRDEASAFLSSEEAQKRIADAAARVEAAPLRLWEAMLWRGRNYRWELVAGEVSLVGELWSHLAANRTLVQCIQDAARAFAALATEEHGWLRCGSIRMRQSGTQVEIRYRPSAADRRVAFAPHTGPRADDTMPCLLGALLAGGDNGKTEMMASYTESIIEVPELHVVAATAHVLADEIRGWVGAEVIISGEDDRGGPRWPEAPSDTWHVLYWKRWVSVLMPLGRSSHLPWDIQTGLHFSDNFLMGRKLSRNP